MESTCPYLTKDQGNHGPSVLIAAEISLKLRVPPVVSIEKSYGETSSADHGEMGPLSVRFRS